MAETHGGEVGHSEVPKVDLHVSNSPLRNKDDQRIRWFATTEHEPKYPGVAPSSI